MNIKPLSQDPEVSKILERGIRVYDEILSEVGDNPTDLENSTVTLSCDLVLGLLDIALELASTHEEYPVEELFGFAELQRHYGKFVSTETKQ